MPTRVARCKSPAAARPKQEAKRNDVVKIAAACHTNTTRFSKGDQSKKKKK